MPGASPGRRGKIEPDDECLRVARLAARCDDRSSSAEGVCPPARCEFSQSRERKPACRPAKAKLGAVDSAHQALLAEIRRRLEETRDDPSITNSDGSNYWGPYVTRAINVREDDGQALVDYVKGVLRKSGESAGWNAVLEGERLDLSFEEMVLNSVGPIRSLFTDDDRRIAARSLGGLGDEIARRREAKESEELERDRTIVAIVATRRRAAGKPWTAEIEAKMLADRAAKRRAADPRRRAI